MQVLMNLYLARGNRLITMPRFELEQFLRLVQEHRVERLFIAPPVAVALAKHPMIDQFDLSSVVMVLSGAAPLGAELSRAVAARLNCAMVQGYGMTEMSPVSHASRPESGRPGTVGPTVASTECRIVDAETGADLPAGREGELWVRGPQVMKGYLNNDRANAETLVQGGWLRTGDIAVFDEDGYLSIRDRLKELIKVKGFQVAPAEVEAALLTHPGIRDAAVIGIPDDEAGEVPMAFVVPAPGATLTLEAVQRHLEGQLARYKLPQRLETVEAVPKSASGKILRRMLKAKVAA
jgi:4-coumarate--CoA ligase